MPDKPELSVNAIIKKLDSGMHWDTDGGTIYFSFPTSNGWISAYGEAAGFTTLKTAQKVAARTAIELWDDLIENDFSETTQMTTGLKIANTTTNIAYAHAFFPGGSNVPGSVFLNPKYNSGTGSNDLYDSPDPGEWGFMSYIHEIGHAMGLSHPSTYGANATFAANATYLQETKQYSLMSYFKASDSGTGTDWYGSSGSGMAQTPMLHDVAAIQAIYGADMTTRTGNTTYGFNATSDVNKQIYDFTVNKNPIMTLYDAGGNDTLDVSGFASASTISLIAGTFSDVNGMTNNIAIAYGTTIENVVTGDFRDFVKGNTGNNRIQTNRGDDIISAGYGDDLLYGGAGMDTIYGGKGNDTVYGGDDFDLIKTNDGKDVIYGGNGNDSVYAQNDDDLIYGGNGHDYLFGGGGNDTFYGGDGDDEMYGGTGDDVFYGGGGRDIMLGGKGNDTYYYEAGVTIREATDRGQGGNDTIITKDYDISLMDHLNVENITATTTATGARNFTLTGNNKSNVLTGSYGNDRLIGGQGNDIMTGGAGRDTFYFNPVNGIDQVTDFEDGLDLISLKEVRDFAVASLGYKGTDMIADGFITLQSTVSGTNVMFDRDGLTGGLKDHVTIGHIAGVSSSMLDASDFVYV
jgi:Ca2+-binding RTX toxin-like protein